MSNNELSRSTHWRAMRNLVFTPLMNYENISVNNYDLYHVKCYNSLGAELQGNNVKCCTSNGYTPFVYSDVYDVYEVPSKQNSTSYNGVEGNFLVFAHNTNFDYWLMADMSYTIDRNKTIEKTFLVANVTYSPWGYYSISAENTDTGLFQKIKTRYKMH